MIKNNPYLIIRHVFNVRDSNEEVNTIKHYKTHNALLIWPRFSMVISNNKVRM